MRLADDVAAARWVSDWVHPFAQDVGSLVPPIFESYARILHPARRGDGTLVRWRDIAEAKGTTLHPLAQLEHLTGLRWPGAHQDGLDGVYDEPPAEGSLDPSVLGALVDVLAAHTTTPNRCWCCVWEGYGLPAASATSLRVTVPQRAFVLHVGTLEEATASFAPWTHQSANLWWPDDASWCVASEIDLVSTYVGASAACVAALVDHPGLEVLPADVSDPITIDADRVNPAP